MNHEATVKVRSIYDVLYRAGADMRCLYRICHAIKPLADCSTRRMFPLSNADEMSGARMADAFSELSDFSVRYIRRLTLAELGEKTKNEMNGIENGNALNKARNAALELIPHYDVTRLHDAYECMLGFGLKRSIMSTIRHAGGHRELAEQCAKFVSDSVELGLLSALSQQEKQLASCTKLLNLMPDLLPIGIKNGEEPTLYAITA